MNKKTLKRITIFGALLAFASIGISVIEFFQYGKFELTGSPFFFLMMILYNYYYYQEK